MRVLVGCEYSGVVRDAFLSRGHYAISCDLLPTERLGPHYQGDIRDMLSESFDLAIFHPPCTYLCSSGLHWNKRRPGRAAQTEDALAFVRLLLNAPINHIALENPIGCISTRIRPPTQIIQPWQFGHAESKATCLWLKNLPALVPTQIMAKPECGHWLNQTPSGQNNLGPSADRWKIRSATYPGIALAFADQWTRATRPNTKGEPRTSHENSNE
jgi:hypothetical protein